MTILKLAIVSTAALALAGCMGGPARTPGFHAALPAPPPAVRPSADGAIYQAAHGYAALHEGNRARRVGDLVVVVLTESIGTNKRTNGQTSRDGSVSITPPGAGPLDFLNPDALKAAAQGSFKGTGSAGQSSSLDGAVAVTIAEVRANGTALVIGEKQMLLSQGDEWIQFAGLIRLADVDYDNRIASTRVADARIIYSGKGAVQQASRPGWLSRFFSAVSPF
ncbi:Flagellar L-ring protein [Alteripontixanthobacter maritimus]|uniref:Flagellar L-ring protein n=1 Tax=Alteripontixanthobacter maritimus TaxID=2161824 RepID=A0A369Q2M4_9SPHN|nr:flagellar basal body L-ring protein FlgH [Alteripontixanthobacter maritimus]RDC59151.1 Flagellar L-ring protein [Alteripontixanthobacter maritimus]